MTTNAEQLLSELEQRLEENRSLSDGGGLKGRWQFWGSLVGLYPWQSLLVMSVLTTILLYLFSPLNLINLSNLLLIIVPGH